MDKVTGQCPQTTTFLKRKESRSGIEPRSSAYQPTALPLGQTGSRFRQLFFMCYTCFCFVAELVRVKKNFRLIVMIATDNKVFWI